MCVCRNSNLIEVWLNTIQDMSRFCLISSLLLLTLVQKMDRINSIMSMLKHCSKITQLPCILNTSAVSRAPNVVSARKRCALRDKSAPRPRGRVDRRAPWIGPHRDGIFGVVAVGVARIATLLPNGRLARRDASRLGHWKMRPRSKLSQPKKKASWIV